MHFDGLGTAPLLLWVAQFLPGGQTQQTSFLGKDRVMEERVFEKPFLALLPPGKREKSFHAAPGLLLQSMGTCSCHTSLLPLTLCSNQPNLSAALLEVVRGAGSLLSTARGHHPDRTGNLCGAQPGSGDTLHLPVKPQRHVLQWQQFKASEREPSIIPLSP